MKHDVFISHSSADRETAAGACDALERRGLACWIAPRDIIPGQDYGEAIIEGIRGSRIFLLIFSGNTGESHQVRREIERAANQGLAIIPFRIEEVMPSKSLEYFISGAHWLDAIEPPLTGISTISAMSSASFWRAPRPRSDACPKREPRRPPPPPPPPDATS